MSVISGAFIRRKGCGTEDFRSQQVPSSRERGEKVGEDLASDRKLAVITSDCNFLARQEDHLSLTSYTHTHTLILTLLHTHWSTQRQQKKNLTGCSNL